MNNLVTLSQDDLITIVKGVLNKPKNGNFGNNLLEFAKRVHIWDYKQNGKTLDTSTQDNFAKDLLPSKPKIIREYEIRFGKTLITESEKGVEYISDFFDFLKENAVPLNEATATVDQILQGLHQSFDGAGTDEDLAMKTILKISSKQVLDQLNAKIKATVGKKFPKIQNLAAWINDEMSELDPTQYDKIWGHLAKMGYRGKETNKFLRAVGKTGEWIGEKWEWTKKNVLGGFFDKLRDALNSGWGTASQLLLQTLGPFTLGISSAIPIVVWGLITTWDMVNLISGTPEWLNLFFDALSMLTAGALSKVLAPFKAAASGARFGTIGNIFSWLSKTKFGQTIAGWIPKLKGLVGTVSSAIKTGVSWVTTKFSKLIGPQMTQLLQTAANKLISWITGFVDSIGKWFGKQTAKAATKEAAGGLSEKLVGLVGKKFATPQFLQTEIGKKFIEKGLKPATVEVVDKYVVSLGKEKGIEETASIVDKKFGSIYGDTIRLAGAAENLSGDKTKLLSSINNFDKKDIEKALKTGKLIAKRAKTTTKSAEQTNVAKNVVVGDVKNIKAGGPQDKNQYKKSGNEYFFAAKTEKVPNWKKITSPKMKQYLTTFIFPQGKNLTSGTA